MHFNQRQRYNNFENPSAVLHNFHNFYSNISVASCWYLTRSYYPFFRGIPASRFYLPTSVPRLAAGHIPTAGSIIISLNNIFQPHLKKSTFMFIFVRSIFYNSTKNRHSTKTDGTAKHSDCQRYKTVRSAVIRYRN